MKKTIKKDNNMRRILLGSAGLLLLIGLLSITLPSNTLNTSNNIENMLNKNSLNNNKNKIKNKKISRLNELSIDNDITISKRNKIDEDNRDEMEIDGNVPNGWKIDSKPEPTQNIDLILAISLDDDIKTFETKLLEVSTPGSSKYGQYYNNKEIAKMMTPSKDKVQNVISYLVSNDIPLSSIEPIGLSQSYLKVKTNIKKAEELLNTEYFIWKHTLGTLTVRSKEYSLPKTISKYIDFVTPTKKFPSPKPLFRMKKRNRAEIVVNDDLTPSSIKSAYNVGSTTGGQSENNKQAVTAFLGEYYNSDDLQTFYKEFSPNLIGNTIDYVIGTNDEDLPGSEASLDVQYITGVGSDISTSFWSYDGYSPDIPQINEPFLDWLLELEATDDPPLVFSTSYGEDEGSTSLNYAKRINIEFIKAGLRGITLLFASGDSGVGSMWGTCDHYTPQWPAASPYITSVGATTGLEKETAAYFSSGGFSNRWTAPSYQQSAISNFIQESGDDLPDTTLWNQTGRGFPDVAAYGVDYAIVLDGSTWLVDGTSCSSPTFAGIVGLINDALLANDKPSLGFLNPLLYTMGEQFSNDITEGTNPGCGFTGFSSSTGWDPVTGFGSPDFEKFKKVAMSLTN